MQQFLVTLAINQLDAQILLL